ncbi:MAG: hypothetical protein KDD42_00930 [Bdellovibrionales bacterium]|nr:hypothetical protein [Bdellovibrionales bacterium]
MTSHMPQDDSWIGKVYVLGDEEVSGVFRPCPLDGLRSAVAGKYWLVVDFGDKQLFTEFDSSLDNQPPADLKTKRNWDGKISFWQRMICHPRLRFALIKRQTPYHSLIPIVAPLDEAELLGDRGLVKTDVKWEIENPCQFYRRFLVNREQVSTHRVLTELSAVLRSKIASLLHNSKQIEFSDMRGEIDSLLLKEFGISVNQVIASPPDGELIAEEKGILEYRDIANVLRDLITPTGEEVSTYIRKWCDFPSVDDEEQREYLRLMLREYGLTLANGLIDQANAFLYPSSPPVSNSTTRRGLQRFQRHLWVILRWLVPVVVIVLLFSGFVAYSPQENSTGWVSLLAPFVCLVAVPLSLWLFLWFENTRMHRRCEINRSSDGQYRLITEIRTVAKQLEKNAELQIGQKKQYGLLRKAGQLYNLELGIVELTPQDKRNESIPGEFLEFDQYRLELLRKRLSNRIPLKFPEGAMIEIECVEIAGSIPLVIQKRWHVVDGDVYLLTPACIRKRYRLQCDQPDINQWLLHLRSLSSDGEDEYFEIESTGDFCELKIERGYDCDELILEGARINHSGMSDPSNFEEGDTPFLLSPQRLDIDLALLIDGYWLAKCHNGLDVIGNLVESFISFYDERKDLDFQIFVHCVIVLDQSDHFTDMSSDGERFIDHDTHFSPAELVIDKGRIEDVSKDLGNWLSWWRDLGFKPYPKDIDVAMDQGFHHLNTLDWHTDDPHQRFVLVVGSGRPHEHCSYFESDEHHEICRIFAAYDEELYGYHPGLRFSMEELNWRDELKHLRGKVNHIWAYWDPDLPQLDYGLQKKTPLFREFESVWLHIDPGISRDMGVVSVTEQESDAERTALRIAEQVRSKIKPAEQHREWRCDRPLFLPMLSEQ